MKKLFATMLATTMLVGSSISAFAYVSTPSKYDGKTDFNDTDYALVGAYDDKGTKITGSTFGGDKLYYPILVSNGELEVDNNSGNDTQMHYVNKASEIEKLKASVKDEIGGKYIDSANIVKKDINIGTNGVVNKPEVLGKFTAAKDLATLKIKDLDLTGDSLKKDDHPVTVTRTVAGNQITFSTSEGSETQVVADKNAQSGELTVKLGGLTFKMTEADVKALAATDTITVGEVKGYSAAVDGGADLGKIYCVEVKLSDYFKNEQTEVEFNIELKKGGKKEFNTKDDVKTKSLFKGEFDLGSDAVILKDGVNKVKFRKNELTLPINKDTRSVKLDKALTSAGVKEDIKNIFLEGTDFSFDVKASDQDDLYLEYNQDAIKDLAVSNQKADLTFFNFPGKPVFDFSGTAKFTVEDEDQDYFFYEIVDGKLVETKAKYNDKEGEFELRTNKLTSYVISDKKLDTAKEEEKEDNTEDKDKEETGGTTETTKPGTSGDKGNANTGATDLIGVASALAVVSIAAAGAVALKK